MKNFSTMKRTVVMLLLLFVFLGKNVAAQDLTFTSRGDFNAAVGASTLSENFDGFSDGQQVINLFSGLVAFASPPPTVFWGNWNYFGTGGNFSGGAIVPQPSFQGKSLILNFSTPVAGLGGNAFDDFDGSPFVNVITLTVTTATGHLFAVSENFGNVGDTGFLGATSSDGIVKAEFSIDNNNGNLEVDLLTVASTLSTNCVSPPSGLVSWWPGENNANDIQSSNHGTLQNGATFAAGKVGQAISFDGVNDFIRIEDNSNLRLVTGEITIDAWVIASPGNTFRAIAAKVGLSFPYPGYALRVTDDNKVEFFAVDCATGSCGFSLPGGSGSRQPVRSTSVVADNNFHHVTGVRRSDGTLEIYVDGVLENTRLELLRNTDSADPFTIGEINAGVPEQPFNGIIDEVDIYNRALSASEIQSIYNAGSAGKCTSTPPPVCVNPPSGLVSWWPGEDNANDIQSSNHGTLQNGATFASGKDGQAFSFDGVDDQIIIPDNPSLRAIGAISIELWVNFARLPRSGGFGDSMTLIEKANDYLTSARTSLTKISATTSWTNLMFFEFVAGHDYLRLNLRRISCLKKNQTTTAFSGSTFSRG